MKIITHNLLSLLETSDRRRVPESIRNDLRKVRDTSTVETATAEEGTPVMVECRLFLESAEEGLHKQALTKIRIREKRGVETTLTKTKRFTCE